MTKPIIAIDIDDVLADSAEGFLAFSNERWNTRLTLEDYSEHWAEMWQVNLEEAKLRGTTWFESGGTRRFRHKPMAAEVLQELAKRYVLLATTSRRRIIQQDTADWLAERYPDIFTAVHHAGIFDDPDHGVEAILVTKADLYIDLGVNYVIDDQLKHCLAAADLGVPAILFGDYPWNQTDGLPSGVTRAANWQAVKDYFDGQD